jgi:hypothetical protein
MVVHTNFHPRKKTESQIKMNRAKLCKKLYEALKQLNFRVIENFHQLTKQQKNDSRALTFVTVEGLDTNDISSMTTHFNISLGNFSMDVTKHQIESEFRKIWVDELGESADIWISSRDEIFVQNGTEQDALRAWNGYIVKEGYKDKSKSWKTDGLLVAECLHIPPRCQP